MADSLERSSCELVIECQRLSYNIGKFHSSIHLLVSYQDCKRERSGWQEEFRDKRAQFFWLWQWQAGDSLPALLTPFDRQQHFNTSAWQQGYHSSRLFVAYINTAVLEFSELHLTGFEITFNTIYFYRVSLL